MDCFLEKVTNDKREVLFRLLQYSLFEESETDLNEMNEDGLFDYKWFDGYFYDSERNAFFIKERKTSKILGFAMVNAYTQKTAKGHSIAEYMIIPKYRRKGLGKKIVIQLFDMYKGNWEVKPSFGSGKAYKFWKNVIENYTKNNYIFEDGIFVFKN